MAQIASGLAALEPQCRAAVDRLVERHRWALLPQAEFVRRTAELLAAGQTSEPYRAAVAVYCRALHAACSGREGEQRQNLAYGELFRYLYDSARAYPDVREDVTQQALERTFRSFERCREPGAFLAFALMHLADAARAMRRQERRAQSVAAPGLLPGPDQPEAAARAISGELRARFDQLSDEFLRKHPRAQQQLAALRLKYIDDMDEEAISRALGKPVGSVYVLRARAIKKLRGDPGWRALAVEFGILPEE